MILPCLFTWYYPVFMRTNSYLLFCTNQNQNLIVSTLYVAFNENLNKQSYFQESFNFSSSNIASEVYNVLYITLLEHWIMYTYRYIYSSEFYARNLRNFHLGCRQKFFGDNLQREGGGDDCQIFGKWTFNPFSHEFSLQKVKM